MKKIALASLIIGLPNVGWAQAIQFANISSFLAWVIQLLLGLGVIAALVGLIISGYKYITSSGNPEAIMSAKNALTYSIIGLIVVLLAILFVRFLLTSLGVTDLGFFNFN